MLTLFATSTVGTTIQADGFRYTLIKEQSECNSNDLWLGKRSLKSCAEECARRRDCRFFIHGKEGTKLDDCYVEYTVGRKCPEGWEEDAFDFWEIGAPWIGCTEPRATNYDSKATLDDGSCKDASVCAAPGNAELGTCRDCVDDGCEAGTNNGYKNRDHDVVYASRVPTGSIKVDGELDEWGLVQLEATSREPSRRRDDAPPDPGARGARRRRLLH